VVLVPALSNLDRTSDAVKVAPPSNFRPLGDVVTTRIRATQFQGAVGRSEAQKAGLRYEAQAQEHLNELLGSHYLQSPSLIVEILGGKSRRLIPDGVYISRTGVATVIEIKSQHMPESWWQLRELYYRAMTRVPRIRWVNLLEVVRSYDPSQPYPEPVVRLQNITPRQFVESSQPAIGVYVWR